VPDEVLVMFEPWADEATRGAVLAAAGLSLIEASPSGLCRTRRTEDAVAGKDVNTAARRARTRAAAAALAGDPAVRCAAPNYIRRIARTPNDEYYDLQWHYPLINLPEAWDLTTGSDDVIVAAIDTGIVTSHPDLQGRVVDGYDFIADLATANDGDGRDADPNDPGDSFGGPGLSSFHGTHVAGTIAATTDNGVGVAGVTFHTRLMPIRAIGVGGGSDFDIAESIRYAAGLANISGRTPAEPADIINMSFSGGAGAGASEVIRVAIRDAANAGLVLVAAAGNEGNELRSYPAAFDEVIAVGAVNLSQLRAAYSNFGSWLSVMAPGGNIGTDFNGDGWADGVLSTGASDAGGNLQYQYRFENGTSMAAPHVSGLTALILAADPHLTAQEVRDILESTARDLGPPGVDDEYGHGLIDALAAVREARRRLGDVNSDEPQLSLSTTTLDFGTQFAELRVAVSNTGGGFLQVSGVTVETLDGDGWLSVQTEGSTDAASVSQIVVRVDRTGLDVGVYGGRVTVAADGVDARTIDVSVSVGTGPDLDELVFVLAVEPDTLVTVGQTATDVAREYQYVLDELPAGRYAVYAGTDRDEDGVICEPGDLCGALPSRIEPAIIELQEGETISGADFAVALNVVRQSAGPPADAIVLRRIE
jgi:serine protease